MSDLDAFLQLNGINNDALKDALHMDIRELILETICQELKKDSNCYIKARRTFYSMSDSDATQKIAGQICHCKLAECDVLWLTQCLKAFFTKNDARKKVSLEERNEVLKGQNSRCALCGKKISLKTLHMDHKISWNFVGDRLAENMQGLCSDCNLKKSNHVAIAVSNMILHAEVAK